MRIAIGCDHHGLQLKGMLNVRLKDQGYEVEDMGTNSTDPVDYPDIASQVAEAVSQNHCQRGILICGTGIGMSITANKVPGIRAALCHDPFTARRSREHNDANILCFGGQTTEPSMARDIVETFLETDFEGGRHLGRVEKISSLESSLHTQPRRHRP